MPSFLGCVVMTALAMSLLPPATSSSLRKLRPECVFSSLSTSSDVAGLRWAFENVLEADESGEMIPWRSRYAFRRGFWELTAPCDPQGEQGAFGEDQLARIFTGVVLSVFFDARQPVPPTGDILRAWWSIRRGQAGDRISTTGVEEIMAESGAAVAEEEGACIEPYLPDELREALRGAAVRFILSQTSSSAEADGANDGAVWDGSGDGALELPARSRLLQLLQASTRAGCSVDADAVRRVQFSALVLLARGKVDTVFALPQQLAHFWSAGPLIEAALFFHSRHPAEATAFRRLPQQLQARFARLRQVGAAHLNSPAQAVTLMALAGEFARLRTQRWQLPQVYVPGMAKAGTTFLWECVAKSGAFGEQAVCPGEDPHALPACLKERRHISVGQKGLEPIKEFHFFNRNCGCLGLGFLVTWLRTMVVSRLPLMLWRNKRFSENPLGARLWMETIFTQFGGTSADSAAIHIDADPWYMADGLANVLLYLAVEDPAALKLLVSLRDPVDRVFSEWSMGIRWPWRNDTFAQCVDNGIQKLTACWPAVREGPEVVMKLPYSEFSRWYRRCMAIQKEFTVHKSLYALHLHYWLALFDREQFHLLTQEGLSASQPLQILEEVGGFLGLELPAAVRQGLQQEAVDGRAGTSAASALVQHVQQLCSQHTAQSWSLKSGPDPAAAERLRSFVQPWTDYLWSKMMPAGMNRTF